MYSEEELSKLREAVRGRLSEKRYSHTLGVEIMAAFLADYCLPEEKQALRAAALLHDIAKELTEQELKDCIKKSQIDLSEDELSAKATLHSFASVHVIKRDFPEFASEKILSACKNHTVGTPEMSVFEEIIFLSDFIEDGRRYESSVKLREKLLSSLSENRNENLKLLHYALASSIESTLEHLKAKKQYINPKTVLTRNSFLSKI